MVLFYNGGNIGDFMVVSQFAIGKTPFIFNRYISYFHGPYSMLKYQRVGPHGEES